MKDRSRAWWIGATIVAVLIAYSLASLLLQSFTGGGTHGRRSSSYATVPTGFAAYASLLSRSGRPVVRLRRPLSNASLDPRTTVVVLDADFVTSGGVRALRRFLDAGGTLVAGGAGADRWLPDLVRPTPESTSRAGRSWTPAAPLPELASVQRVASAGDSAWSDSGAAVPALTGRGGALLAVDASGGGRAELLADASPLQNRLLGRADNAALGLALAGPPGRPVVFVESVHGYGEASGLAAVPGRWWWCFAALGLAGLVFAIARGRRLGPAERETRPLPPARREYVDALGGVLARTRKPREAAEPVRRAARDALVRRAGTAGDPGDDALRRTATAAGFQQDELDAVFDGVTDDRGLMATGRALARTGTSRRARA